jgi:transposase-like protein
MAVSETSAARTCPSCGSTSTVHVQRGFAGSTDENDQYYTCTECGLVTYEIVSRSERELRMHRLEPGRKVKLAGWDYTVSRVLKVGLNESLVYVKALRRAE